MNQRTTTAEVIRSLERVLTLIESEIVKNETRFRDFRSYENAQRSADRR